MTMDTETTDAALQYADLLAGGAEARITTNAAMRLIEALANDPTGDDFARAVLTAAATEEVVDEVRCAATIRALLA